jgi:hypothetical protein
MRSAASSGGWVCAAEFMAAPPAQLTAPTQHSCTSTVWHPVLLQPQRGVQRWVGGSWTQSLIRVVSQPVSQATSKPAKPWTSRIMQQTCHTRGIGRPAEGSRVHEAAGVLEGRGF